MEIQKRERGTKIIPNHALDKIRNPSEACLSPSRPSLTRYALEMMELLDQTDLKDGIDAT